MDGYEVCSIIKKNPAISEIPIIFITAKTDSESIIKGFESGAIYYWRISGGNEVDFVLSDIAEPKAIEAKYDKTQVKVDKYKLFTEAYPEIPLQFIWINLFEQDFFRRTKP